MTAEIEHRMAATSPRAPLAALALAALGACASPPDPCADVTVTLAEPTVRLRAWLPTDVPSARRDVVVSPASCAVEVSTEAPWLDARLEGTQLVVDGDTSASGAGLHTTDVVFTRPGSSAVVATVPVTLSVIVRAPADGEPHALVVGIDGCRPDGIVAADAPSLDALTALGRSTYTASTQLTAGTISGPGWASILTGVEAEDHLVDGNDDLAEVALAAHPTFLRRALDGGLTVDAAPQWIGILQLLEPEIAREARAGTAAGVTAEAAELLATDVDLLFVHLDDVDHAGHDTGFSPTNPDYTAAIQSVDAHVTTMLDAILARPTLATERWLVALTTDHGGSGTGHGALDAENRTIFVILADLGGEPAALPATGVSHMDVAPSVLQHLGVALEPTWGLDGVAR